MAPVDSPTIAKGASHVSDVRFSHTLSPDEKSISIIFDNFAVRLGPAGPPVATRMLSMTFPLAGGTVDAVAKVDFRGSAGLEAGATGTAIFRVFGETHVLEPLLGPGDANPGDYVKQLVLKAPAGSNLDMTFVVIAERGGNTRGDTAVTLDSIDISLGPVEPK